MYLQVSVEKETLIMNDENIIALPWFATIIKYLHLCKIDAVIIQFKPAFVDWSEIWMQYHVTVVRHNESITIHAEFVRQRKFADVVDRHVCTGYAEQCVIRHICHVVSIALAFEHRGAHRSQQSIFLPLGGIQGGRVLFNVLIFMQLRKTIARMKNSFNNNISFPFRPQFF